MEASLPQGVLDHEFGVDAPERAALARGRVPMRLWARWPYAARPGWPLDLGLASAVAVGVLAGAWPLTGLDVPVLVAGGLVALGCVSPLRDGVRRMRLLGARPRARAVDAEVRTEREWHPDAGLAHTLVATLVVGTDRYFLGSRLGDLVVEGPARVLLWQITAPIADLPVPREEVVAVELLLGGRLVQRPAGRPPPNDRLQAGPAD